MSIQIVITGDNAAQAIEELCNLSRVGLMRMAEDGSLTAVKDTAGAAPEKPAFDETAAVDELLQKIADADTLDALNAIGDDLFEKLSDGAKREIGRQIKSKRDELEAQAGAEAEREKPKRGRPKKADQKAKRDDAKEDAEADSEPESEDADDADIPAFLKLGEASKNDNEPSKTDTEAAAPSKNDVPQFSDTAIAESYLDDGTINKESNVFLALKKTTEKVSGSRGLKAATDLLREEFGAKFVVNLKPEQINAYLTRCHEVI